HHLEGARLAMAVRVLARMVDVEVVVRVLGHRHAQAAQLQCGNELFDEVGLACAAEAGESDDFHGQCAAMNCLTRSASAGSTVTRRGRASMPSYFAGRSGSRPRASTMVAANLIGSAVSRTTMGTPS